MVFINTTIENKHALYNHLILFECIWFKNRGGTDVEGSLMKRETVLMTKENMRMEREFKESTEVETHFHHSVKGVL